MLLTDTIISSIKGIDENGANDNGDNRRSNFKLLLHRNYHLLLDQPVRQCLKIVFVFTFFFYYTKINVLLFFFLVQFNLQTIFYEQHNSLVQ